MNINLSFQTMKRAKYERKAGPEDEAMSSSELSPCMNIRYRLRTRYIFDYAGKPSSKVDTFTQQQEASKFMTYSVNDRFTGEPSIMMLPNEVLSMIFSYLDVHELSTSVAPVCKDWYRIAHNPILWRKLCFDGKRVSTEIAKRLLTKSPLLSELIIANR